MSTTVKNFLLGVLLVVLCFMIKSKLDSNKTAIPNNSIGKDRIEVNTPETKKEKQPRIDDDQLKKDSLAQLAEKNRLLEENKLKEERALELVAKQKEEEKTSKIAAAKKKVKKPKKKPIKPSAKIEFEETSWDFGEITEGDIVKKQFKFKNTGNADLQIIGADASCGCARPTVPFLNIAPGKYNEIGITYNSVNKDGEQNPEIIIKSNTYPKHNILKLHGTVIPKKKGEKDSSEMTKDTILKQ